MPIVSRGTQAYEWSALRVGFSKGSQPVFTRAQPFGVFRGFLRNSRKYGLGSLRKTPTEGTQLIGLGPSWNNWTQTYNQPIVRPEPVEGVASVGGGVPRDPSPYLQENSERGRQASLIRLGTYRVPILSTEPLCHWRGESKMSCINAHAHEQCSFQHLKQLKANAVCK